MPKKSNSLSKSELAVADRIHSASIRVLRMVRAQDAAGNIGPAQLSALSVLVFGGAMSLKNLAEAEQVRPPTMSRVVAALEQQRLVRRQVLRNDRREVRLQATAAGNTLLQRARKRRVALLAQWISKLTATEGEQLKVAAEIILRMARN